MKQVHLCSLSSLFSEVLLQKIHQHLQTNHYYSVNQYTVLLKGAWLTAVGLIGAVGAVRVLVTHPQLGDAVHSGLTLEVCGQARVFS